MVRQGDSLALARPLFFLNRPSNVYTMKQNNLDLQAQHPPSLSPSPSAHSLHSHSFSHPFLPPFPIQASLADWFTSSAVKVRQYIAPSAAAICLPPSRLPSFILS